MDPRAARNHFIAELEPAVDFGQAIARLEAWKMFELDWPELRAVGPAAPGQRAVIVARVASLRIENPIVVTQVERSDDRFEMWLAAQPGHPTSANSTTVGCAPCTAARTHSASRCRRWQPGS